MGELVLTEVRRIVEFQMFDMVNEGVYVIETHVGPLTGDRAKALPAVYRAEWVPEVEQCYLRTQYDGDNLRIITNDDLPMRVVRNGPEPPIRCDLAVEPCDRCPRRSRQREAVDG